MSAWETSDSIAVAALVVAVLSGIASYGVSVYSIRKQFEEKLHTEKISLENDFAHVYSVERTKLEEPYVKRIAKRYRFRVSNQSNKPLTIVSAYYREGAQALREIPTPFVKSLSYENDSVTAGALFNLPIKLEVGEVIDFYVLLPVSVNQRMGRALLQLFLKNKVIPKSNADLLIYGSKEFWDHEEKRLIASIDFGFLNDAISLTGLDFGTIEKVREIFPEKDGRPTFVDSNNNADDGFVFMKSSDLRHAATSRIFEEDHVPPYRFTDAQFSDYSVIFETPGRKLHQTLLKLEDFDHFDLTQFEHL